MKKLYRILGKRGRITIPYEIRKRIGFAFNDVLSFTESADGKTVSIKKEKLCNNCKEAPPASKDNAELFDFLDSLSKAEQKTALVHLSVLWAENQKEEK